MSPKISYEAVSALISTMGSEPSKKRGLLLEHHHKPGQIGCKEKAEKLIIESWHPMDRKSFMIIKVHN